MINFYFFSSIFLFNSFIDLVKRISNSNILYKGDFINNLKEGNGIEITNTSKFESTFIKDKQNGFDKINFNNDDFYEGNVLNNKFDGKGHFFWKKNNKEYIGNYTNGVFNREGLYKCSEN